MIFNLQIILGLITMLITLINAKDGSHSNIRKHLLFPNISRLSSTIPAATTLPASTPVASTPVASTPVASTPVASIPAAAIPVASTPQNVVLQTKLVSTSGTIVPNIDLSFSLSIKQNKITQASDKAAIQADAKSDEKGQILVNFKAVDLNKPYSCSVSAKSLIPNYFYSDPIQSGFVVTFADATAPTVSKTPIQIMEGGFQGYQINGKLSSVVDSLPINGVKLILATTQNTQTLQAIATTNSMGLFSFNIFGLPRATFTGTITVDGVLQGYDTPVPISKISIDSKTTIVNVAEIKLALAKTCNLVGCSKCSAASTFNCETCSAGGYKLDETTKRCQFTGEFTGDGSISVTSDPFSEGKQCQVVGTMKVLKKLTPDAPTQTEQPISIGLGCFYLRDPLVCVGTGGTNSLGQFSIKVKSFNLSGSYDGSLKVTATGYMDQTIPVRVSSDSNQVDLGTLIMMTVAVPASSR